MARKTNLHLQQLLIDLLYHGNKQLHFLFILLSMYYCVEIIGQTDKKIQDLDNDLLQTNNYIGSDLLGVYSLDLPGLVRFHGYFWNL